MKEGAFYYLTKPIDLDELEVIINRAKEQMILLSENKLLREQIKDKFSFTGLVSVSQKMEEVLNIASRIASSKASILIRGESGTGKEVIAKAIHFSSPRKDKPFVAISCASLNENLLESEMFGHEKGSFTGADKQKQGRFELADSGTLFLDEIGDLPLSTQIKLLRVLQESKFERVGGTQTLEVDVRILAATNRNIEQLIKEEKFREDLYYRLNVVTINVPALRDRREDILPLINNFLKKYSSETDKKDIKFSREAIDKLLKYSFPGNVRELENIVHHSIVLARDNIITTQDLPSNLMSQSTSIDFNSMEISLPEKVNALEISLVKSALEKTSGNQSAAARLLGISERNLRYKLEKWDMKKD